MTAAGLEEQLDAAEAARAAAESRVAVLTERLRGTDAEERGLPTATDDAVLAAMVADPRLIERPLVETEKGTALCRPQEKVLALL